MPLLYNRFSRKDNDPQQQGEKGEPLSLYQLNRRICEALEEAFPKSYWVVAEVAEVSRYASGHCYLTLMDKGSEASGNRDQARAKATIWNNRYQRISQVFEAQTGHPLKPGLKILLSATVKFHELHGLSLDIQDIDPNYTLGDLARQRQETINRLQAEGLFGRNKFLVIPEVPQRLAIISSPAAAGLQDFMHQLLHNPYGYDFRTELFAASVQGQEAVPSITRALEQIRERYRHFDAVVILRGGGSQTDLYCFDQYAIASAVAACPLPVLSGIGHERDETITDLVANTRLKTPTAVAAFLIDRAREFEENLLGVFQRIREEAETRLTQTRRQLGRVQQELYQVAQHYLRAHTLNLQELTSGLQVRQQLYLQEMHNIITCQQIHLVTTTNQRLARKRANLRETERDVQQGVKVFLNLYDGKLQHLSYCLKGASKDRMADTRLLLTNNHQRMAFLLRNKVTQSAHHLELLEVKISLHDPEAMLLRGYTLTYSEGKLVKSLENLQPGQVLETRLAGGTLQSTLTQIKEDSEPKDSLF